MNRGTTTRNFSPVGDATYVLSRDWRIFVRAAFQ